MRVEKSYFFNVICIFNTTESISFKEKDVGGLCSMAEAVSIIDLQLQSLKEKSTVPHRFSDGTIQTRSADLIQSV